MDKAATPAERAYHRNLERTRPQTLVPQRDSDANRDVLASRDSALSQLPYLKLKTGANLLGQFESQYIPRVFCTTLPHVVGGPDFPGRPSWRRIYDDSEPVSLNLYTTMMASRCEYQVRTDWDLQPGLFSLAFASRVNLGQPRAIRRALRRGAGE